VLERLSLRDGVFDFGTAITNRGTLALHDVVLTGNRALDVGAIDNQGSLSLVDSDIRGNIVDIVGGGITCDSPILALTAKTFSGATVAGQRRDRRA
jgi:hypothetical protein